MQKSKKLNHEHTHDVIRSKLISLEKEQNKLERKLSELTTEISEFKQDFQQLAKENEDLSKELGVLRLKLSDKE